MTTLTLRYRALVTDPWTLAPALGTAFPSVATGALPLVTARIASGPATETPCGCPGDSTDDSHLILRLTTAPLPLTLEASILTFLIHYKNAAFHEAKMERFGQGGFVSASLSQIDSRERHGVMHLSLRLAAAMNDTLTNL